MLEGWSIRICISNYEDQQWSVLLPPTWGCLAFAHHTRRFGLTHSNIWPSLYKEKLKQINMISTDDELIAEFPKSKVTQVYLSFSPDGGFTPHRRVQRKLWVNLRWNKARVEDRRNWGWKKRESNYKALPFLTNFHRPRLSFSLCRNPSHWRLMLLIDSRCMDVTHFTPGGDSS